MSYCCNVPAYACVWVVDDANIGRVINDSATCPFTPDMGLTMSYCPSLCLFSTNVRPFSMGYGLFALKAVVIYTASVVAYVSQYQSY